MTILSLNMPLKKWLHQNNVAYVEGFFEGSLLDNYLVQCENGTAAIYEKYVNCWESCYEVHFGRSETDIENIVNDFWDRAKEFEATA